MRKIKIQKIIEIISFISILGISLVFGFLGKPAEMGLAIVAGGIAFSFVNLDKFSKIKGAGFEVDLVDLRGKIETIIEKETEYSVSGEDENSVPNSSLVDKNTRAVIDALQHHNYTWRYLGGIKTDTKLTETEINTSIKWLIENAYVKQSIGKHGIIWNLTNEGRHLSAVIDFENLIA